MKKRSALSFTDCVFEDNGTAISVPAGTEMDLTGTRFTRNGQAVEVRDAPSALAILGLPDDAPIWLVREALDRMMTVRSAPTLTRRERFRATRLANWLITKGSDLTTIIANVAQITADPRFPQLVQFFNR